MSDHILSAAEYTEPREAYSLLNTPDITAPDAPHVFPNIEYDDHTFDGLGCWCRPTLTSSNVVVHHRTRAD